MPYLTQRTLTAERMDADDVPIDRLRRSLAFIRWVNRRLGGSRVVVSHLARWSRRWPQGQTIRVLDVATGSADIPLAIARWARRAGHDVRVTALDRHPTTLALAAEHVGDEPGIELVRADALDPPFPPNSFDYCTTSMFLHHLPDIQVMTCLRIMDRLATRGLIWNDLLRHRRAVWWTRLLTALADPIVKHDAVVSVEAGFRRHEVESFRDRLGLHHLKYQRHFAHRFTLAGER